MAIIAVILTLAVIGTVFLLLPENTETDETKISADTDGDGEITYRDYNGKRIGIKTGSSFEPITFEYFPDSEYVYFDTTSDLVTALKNNKIDAFLEDEPVMRMVTVENDDLDYISKPIKVEGYSFIFPKNSEKGDKLLTQFNELLSKLKENGKLVEMSDKWFGSDDTLKTFDRISSSGENGELLVAGGHDKEPFNYYLNNEYTGYAVELITVFAQEYGYGIRFETPNLAAELAGVASGKYDIGIGAISVTNERKENVNFSDTVYNGGVVLMARGNELHSLAYDLPISSFDGKRAGVITGSMHDSVIGANLPNATIYNYNNYSDLVAALRADKIDFFLGGYENVALLRKEMPDLIYLELPIATLDCGALFPKTDEADKLRGEFDGFLKKIKADGTLEKIRHYWMSDDCEGDFVEVEGLSAENGTIRFVNDTIDPPLSFISNGKVAGIEPDLIVRFCKEYGYGLEFINSDLAGLIPGLTTGMYDMGMGGLVITEERKQSVNFSIPYVSSDLLIITDPVKTGDTGSKVSFFESIADSFEKNFIREDRWKLIVEGIGTTCLITSLSALFGSVLAFLVCMFRRTGSRLANLISDIYVKLLQGTPIVVLLMILYYVILGKTGLEAVWVAIIGFTLNFGAYASEIMRSGIESIDPGQREAALALGYSENQTFFRFIFPQAAVRFLPVYRGEVVSLLKSTSIVGYIAIQDLTKMSDIIRSRTYEAFFPLIATAVIYFILAWIISMILKLILKVFDRKHKKGGTAK